MEIKLFEVDLIILPETNIFAPKNGWLEYDPFLLGRPIFRGELLVSGRVEVTSYLSSLCLCRS